MQFAAYDGDPNNGDDTHGANFGFGHNGVLFFGEVGYKTKIGLWSMPSRYSFGGYYHTGDFPDVAEDSLGQNNLSERARASIPGRKDSTCSSNRCCIAIRAARKQA